MVELHNRDCEYGESSGGVYDNIESRSGGTVDPFYRDNPSTDNLFIAIVVVLTALLLLCI